MPSVHHSTAKAIPNAFQRPSCANARHGSIIRSESVLSALRAAAKRERRGCYSSAST